MNNNFTQSLCSEILPGLWQGGTDDFDTVEYPKKQPFWGASNRWNSVATLYAPAQPMGWGVSERRFGFPDSPLEMEMEPEILSIANWLYAEWKSGKHVLARCQAGWNRSGLVIALVLIRDGLSPFEAIQLIREKRGPNALCNQDFVQYLMSLKEAKSA